jgi:hypothetical protein
MADPNRKGARRGLLPTTDSTHLGPKLVTLVNSAVRVMWILQARLGS